MTIHNIPTLLSTREFMPVEADIDKTCQHMYHTKTPSRCNPRCELNVPWFRTLSSYFHNLEDLMCLLLYIVNRATAAHGLFLFIFVRLIIRCCCSCLLLLIWRERTREQKHIKHTCTFLHGINSSPVASHAWLVYLYVATARDGLWKPSAILSHRGPLALAGPAWGQVTGLGFVKLLYSNFTPLANFVAQESPALSE